MEALRRGRAVAEVTGDGAEEARHCSAEEELLMASMEAEKRAYKEGAVRLRELKAEIEHLQHILAQSRRRLQQDFESWYAAKGAAAADDEQPTTRAVAAMERGQGKGAAGGSSSGGPPLTGNAEVDAEILAFYQARETLVAQRMQGGR